MATSAGSMPSAESMASCHSIIRKFFVHMGKSPWLIGSRQPGIPVATIDACKHNAKKKASRHVMYLAYREFLNDVKVPDVFHSTLNRYIEIMKRWHIEKNQFLAKDKQIIMDDSYPYIIHVFFMDMQDIPWIIGSQKPRVPVATIGAKAFNARKKASRYVLYLAYREFLTDVSVYDALQTALSRYNEIMERWYSEKKKFSVVEKQIRKKKDDAFLANITKKKVLKRCDTHIKYLDLANTALQKKSLPSY